MGARRGARLAVVAPDARLLSRPIHTGGAFGRWQHPIEMFQTISQRLAARSASRALGLSQAVSTLLAAAAIFLLALAPRALALGRFVTIDEAYHWFDRARQFLGAIRAGDW